MNLPSERLGRDGVGVNSKASVPKAGLDLIRRGDARRVRCRELEFGIGRGEPDNEPEQSQGCSLDNTEVLTHVS